MKKRSASRAQLVRGNPTLGLSAGELPVDREERVIRGASIISTGELIGHDLEADATTLDQVVKLAGQSGHGIKVRFGHPTMSANAEGTFLGRARDFRLDGQDVVRADIHLDDTAFQADGPHGNMGDYVLDLAESDPGAFGVSIVVDGDREQRLNEDGTAAKDEDGNTLPALLRVKRLWAADVVDEPATGDDMFARTVVLSATATEQLDKLCDDPNARDVVVSYLRRYAGLRAGQGRSTKLVDELLTSLTSGQAASCGGIAAETTDTINLSRGDEAMPESMEQQQPNAGQGPTDALKAASEKERAELKAAAAKEERERIDTIRKLGARVGADQAVIEKLIADGTSVNDAAKTLAAVEDARLQGARPPNVTVNPTGDEIDKFRAGTALALSVNAGVADEKERVQLRGSGFNGMGLQAFARECLSRAGRGNVHLLSSDDLFTDTIRLARMEFGGAAAQGTGDFTNVLSNVVNKSLGKGWGNARVTYPLWTGTGTASDFKKFRTVRLSEFSDVDVIPENVPPKFGRMADTYEEGNLFTIGKAWILSRQAMVNDDLNALTRVPEKFTRSVRRYINRYVYTLLYGTSFAGPTMKENDAVMFSTARGNLASGNGGAPSASTMKAGYEAMLAFAALTPGDDSNTQYLGVPPRYILHGPSTAVGIYQLLGSQYYVASGADGANTGSQIANVWGPGGPRNLVPIEEVLIDHLDGTYAAPWYLAADQNEVDTVIVYTLSGRDAPVTRSEPSSVTEAQGMKWDTTFDFTAVAGDWRGMYCNKGGI